VEFRRRAAQPFSSNSSNRKVESFPDDARSRIF
jgi:hypothetical protein